MRSIEELLADWKRRDTTGDDAYLAELANLLEGRTVKDSDGATRSVTFRGVTKGQAFFAWVGAHHKTIHVELKIGSSMLLTLGAKPSWRSAIARLDGEASPVYYFPSQSDPESIRAWLATGGAQAIRELSLTPEDCVEIWDDKTQFSGPPAIPQAIRDKTLAIVALVHSLPRPPSRARRIHLPVGFKDLEPLAGRWAISDDADRSDLMARGSLESLRSLVEAVQPRFAEINALLDAAGEPLSDELVALQTLAEAAAEAQLDLGRRGSRDIGQR